MFALDINFSDGISKPEVLLVKRSNFLIGGDESAHVVIEEIGNLGYQLSVKKDLGRKFSVKPTSGRVAAGLPKQLEGTYEGQTMLKAGQVSIRIYSLDADLALRDGETPDRAGVRVLRQASLVESSDFPALVIRAGETTVVSFTPDQVLYAGRANQCIIRLDTADVSNKHARFGYESGKFWVEDLGSTNGTFVNGQQISGRMDVAPGNPIVLGSSSTIVGVINNEQLEVATNLASMQIKKPSSQKYPVLIAASEIARPARVVLPPGEALTIGRDPSSDLWLGAPHVSRKHCSVKLLHTGQTILTDHSTNGTNYGYGLLENSESIELSERPHVLDFGGDVTVAICFNEDQERTFVTSNGSPQAFLTTERERRATASLSVNSGKLNELASVTNAEQATYGTNATIALGRLLRNLSLPAQILLTLGVIAFGFLFWIVVSLILKMI